MPRTSRPKRIRYRANGRYLIANNIRIQLLKKKRDGKLTSQEEAVLADVTKTCAPKIWDARRPGLKKAPKRRVRPARIWAHGKK